MPMLLHVARAWVAAGALLLAGPASAEPADAVGTTGTATLRMCQSWVVYHTCRSYHHIAVPERIAVGDTIPLEFGSNPKQYQFPVARISRSGNRCKVYSETGDSDHINRLTVEPCPAAVP